MINLKSKILHLSSIDGHVMINTIGIYICNFTITGRSNSSYKKLFFIDTPAYTISRNILNIIYDKFKI